MPVATIDPWSPEQAEATLRQLRKDFPGYTPNELYAIWCHVNGKIPLDPSGKVLLEQWKFHAQEDGKYIEGGPFRVSTALFGRAQLAKKGMTKPPRKAQVKRAAPEPRPAMPSSISGTAMAFARSYDKAAKTLDSVLQKQHEIDELLEEIRKTRLGVLIELAAASPEAKNLLEEAGLLD